MYPLCEMNGYRQQDLYLQSFFFCSVVQLRNADIKNIYANHAIANSTQKQCVSALPTSKVQHDIPFRVSCKKIDESRIRFPEVIFLAIVVMIGMTHTAVRP